MVGASIVAIFAFAAAAATSGGIAKGKRIIQPFDFKGVTLEGGRLRREFDRVREYYLTIPLDDLLCGYRLRAGLPHPGKELGGWYTSDSGNVLPQIMSGLARMYAATGDDRCLEKADAMLTEWAKCIAPDGYFFYSIHPTSRQYYYEKVVGAMVDMCIYCHRTDALEYLERVTDWAEKNLNRAREYANSNGDPLSPLCDHSEWYTVSENLYRAYLLTGNARYRVFGRAWEYTDYWNIFAERGDIFGTRHDGGKTEAYHAYSHVNTFASDAAAYLVSGESHYLATLVNAYDFLQSDQVFATGGFGPNEQLAPHQRIVDMLKTTSDTFETQCGSWAAFKMSKYLTSFTGDAKYGDWVERLMLNGIGVSLPMSSSGQITYYSNYRIGGASKELFPDGWSCCTGTCPQATADFYDQIYFRAPHTLYVSQYAPSTVALVDDGKPFAVRQETRFPETSESLFKIVFAPPTMVALKLRVPGWIAGPVTATLNGNPVPLVVDAHRWAVIDRIWHEGDKLVVTLPAKLWTCRMDSGTRSPGAVMYGPVVLAFRSLDGDPTSKIDLDHPEDCLVPIEGEPLNFHLKSDPNILARPFYDYKQGERYYMYFESHFGIN